MIAPWLSKVGSPNCLRTVTNSLQIPQIIYKATTVKNPLYMQSHHDSPKSTKIDCHDFPGYKRHNKSGTISQILSTMPPEAGHQQWRSPKKTGQHLVPMDPEVDEDEMENQELVAAKAAPEASQ